MVEASRLPEPQPLLKTEWIKRGALVVPYGTMSAVELSLTDIMDKIVVDDWGQCQERQVRRAARPCRDRPAERGQRFMPSSARSPPGTRRGRESDDETILFWHRGLSLSDIALGKAMLDQGAARPASASGCASRERRRPLTGAGDRRRRRGGGRPPWRPRSRSPRRRSSAAGAGPRRARPCRRLRPAHLRAEHRPRRQSRHRRQRRCRGLPAAAACAAAAARSAIRCRRDIVRAVDVRPGGHAVASAVPASRPPSSGCCSRR